MTLSRILRVISPLVQIFRTELIHPKGRIRLDSNLVHFKLLSLHLMVEEMADSELEELLKLRLLSSKPLSRLCKSWSVLIVKNKTVSAMCLKNQTRSKPIKTSIIHLLRDKSDNRLQGKIFLLPLLPSSSHRRYQHLVQLVLVVVNVIAAAVIFIKCSSNSRS